MELVQEGRTTVLVERHYVSRPPWAFWGPRTTADTLRLGVGKETVPDLRPGQATLRVVAGRAPAWLRRPAAAVRETTLPVRLVPPALDVTSTRHYLAQGGCEAVVYRVAESSVRDGVQVGSWFFPGHPLPGGGARDRFALFGAPYDLESDRDIRLVAEDEVGNRAGLSFVDRYQPRLLHTDTIRLDDAFLERVVPEILSRTPELRDRGSLLPNYLEINGDLRRRDAEILKKLARGSAPRFLWRGAFEPWRNGKVMSSFADRRTYLYQGREVDRQDHLGIDLASTRHAEVTAANAGVVAFADFLGIYGNAVVIDHGYGLMSLYGHLSSIDVKVGQEVAKGQALGRSGQTGLAGGDHLHFTMLLQGLPVTPIEWWDPHWVHDRIAGKLGAALPTEGT